MSRLPAAVGQLNAIAGEDAALSVQGLVVTILGDHGYRGAPVSRCPTAFLRLVRACARAALLPNLQRSFAVRLDAPLGRVEEARGKVVSNALVARRLP
jgi:hypothetical protein